MATRPTHPTTQAAAKLQQLAEQERPWFALVYEDDNKQVKAIKHMRCDPIDFAVALLDGYEEMDIDDMLSALRKKLVAVSEKREQEAEAVLSKKLKAAGRTGKASKELPF